VRGGGGLGREEGWYEGEDVGAIVVRRRSVVKRFGGLGLPAYATGKTSVVVERMSRAGSPVEVEGDESKDKGKSKGRKVDDSEPVSERELKMASKAASDNGLNSDSHLDKSVWLSLSAGRTSSRTSPRRWQSPWTSCLVCPSRSTTPMVPKPWQIIAAAWLERMEDSNSGRYQGRQMWHLQNLLRPV